MAAAGGDHEVIDVEALVSNLQRKMSGKMFMPPRCSIFKIPIILSRHNKNAYTPNAFSFGPFHHDNDQLKPTEKIKFKYLLGLVCRLSRIDPNPITPDTILRNLTNAISDVEKEALQYYAGPIGMKVDKFVEILVLDGCFILELFRKKSYSELREKDDPIFNMSCMLQFLSHDLILLENQIPWLVLDLLFKLTITTSVDNKSLVELAIDFFSYLFTENPPRVQSILCIIQNHENKHILDLLRNSLVLNSSITKQKSHKWQHMRSATGLRDSGITFKQNLFSDSVLDITFCKKKGVMLIPPLLIHETTETVFRNLISLEQCCPNYEPIVTSYAVLLDNLIDTNTDIQILEKSNAIVNWLNIDDATKFFNKLYIDTYVKENYYHQLTSDVNGYCRKSWHKYRRILKRDYFKHPWALMSVIAASVALILTFLQTLYAMK
ncbi:hypothetical protein PanWU01x14_147240 [Parasponia andersonii]|uniref:Uncharacterized protein n=1 Tax=Parasponia andersonii TaxID=3476 RepID=A0A2P5CJY1_PARAD|nr:hypothetical protein PanWU01x14_147240 [Parasponia andersonii]